MDSVILLPGLACDGDVWRHQQPALARAHAVHVSDVHFRFDTLPEMAAALLAEHPGRHVLVGHSMGGMLALEAARQAPERVAALALLGSSARPDTPELLKLRRDACVLFEQGRADEVIGANVLFAFHAQTLQLRRAVVDDYLTMMRRAGGAGLARQNRAVMARIDSRPFLPALRCPLLVVCGEHDQLAPPEHAREMAALVPQAALAFVAGAGHMLTMEQPDAVNALLRDWLASLPARR
jgi:pimeloyl-ACP methyl ester carboxylesterase